MNVDGFVYFSSNDVGAPTLTGTTASIVGVMDWVLLDLGGGASGENGWDKVYSNSTAAAYRSKTGQRKFLRVEQKSTDGFDINYSIFRGYNDMGDIDTGTDPFPTLAQANNGGGNGGMSIYVGTFTAVDNVPRYFGVRTNEFVMLFLNVDNYGCKYFFFGEVDSLLPTDGHSTVIGTSRGYTDTLTSIAGSNSEAYTFFAKDPSGTEASCPAYLDCALQANASTPRKADGAAQGQIILYPIYLHTTRPSSGGTRHSLRAILPFAQRMWGSAAQRESLLNVYDCGFNYETAGIAGKEYKLMRDYHLDNNVRPCFVVRKSTPVNEEDVL